MICLAKKIKKEKLKKKSLFFQNVHPVGKYFQLSFLIFPKSQKGILAALLTTYKSNIIMERISISPCYITMSIPLVQLDVDVFRPGRMTVRSLSDLL